MSNQLMNPCKSANHFVELLSCILTNRTKFTYISQTMYQLVCKLFIFSFSCLQTIYLGSFDFANNFFGIFHPLPPPLQKNNGPSLRASDRCTEGHGFDSRRGLRFFLCPTLATATC